ncbi:MAG: ABC transporter permease [Phycisphaerales bacterium]|nr:ABC transporter permease [Phycisphaerales bacterium]
MATLPITDTPRSFASYLGPIPMARALWANRELTTQFAARNIRGRYKGQALGSAWSLLDPLMLLAIYTFVFGVIFRRVDAAGDGGIARYALEVFGGILIFGVFRDTVGAAPFLIVSHANFVKKVVYPLETLVVSQLLVALFNLAVGLAVWLLGFVIFSEAHVPGPGILLLPVVILPVALLALGLSWFLASLGVFLRDLRTPVGSIMQMLFFLSAIFYRIEDVPEPYRAAIAWNPMAQAVAAGRAVMFGDAGPDWPIWGAMTAAGVLLSLAGYAFFMKSRRAFADVI